MGRHILFKCPETGLNVQHWLDELEPDDRHQKTYVSVRCSACNKLHFINPADGRLLGEAKP